MLRAVIIGSESDPSHQLETLLGKAGRFGVSRSVEGYVSGKELERMLRAHAPQVVLLGVDALDRALTVRAEVEQIIPSVPVVAFGSASNHEVLLEPMKVGIREVLSFPIEPQDLHGLADRLEELLSRNPPSFESTDLVFSFLPAKPGVGASTVALNVASALSRQPDWKVLLADFDLNSGLLAFMLKMYNPFSLMDAVEKSVELDENLWSRLVSELGDLQVLSSGRSSPGVRIQPAHIHHVLAFARRLYGAICVDLSGNMEKYSVELMQESKRIFLVCTPEIPPLHLARERINFLRNIDLGDRVCVLLNRWHKRSAMSISHIENLLSVPVFGTLPNNYQGVHRSLVEGRPVDAASELGRRFTALAARMLESQLPAQSRPKKKFLEYLSIVPARYSLSK